MRTLTIPVGVFFGLGWTEHVRCWTTRLWLFLLDLVDPLKAIDVSGEKAATVEAQFVGTGLALNEGIRALARSIVLGSGVNEDGAPRRCIDTNWCLPWMRQQENWGVTLLQEVLDEASDKESVENWRASVGAFLEAAMRAAPHADIPTPACSPGPGGSHVSRCLRDAFLSAQRGVFLNVPSSCGVERACF